MPPRYVVVQDTPGLCLARAFALPAARAQKGMSWVSEKGGMTVSSFRVQSRAVPGRSMNCLQCDHSFLALKRRRQRQTMWSPISVSVCHYLFIITQMYSTCSEFFTRVCNLDEKWAVGPLGRWRGPQTSPTCPKGDTCWPQVLPHHLTPSTSLPFDGHCGSAPLVYIPFHLVVEHRYCLRFFTTVW